MAKECSNSSCTKESCEGCPSKEGGGIQKEMQQNSQHIQKLLTRPGNGNPHKHRKSYLRDYRRQPLYGT